VARGVPFHLQPYSRYHLSLAGFHGFRASVASRLRFGANLVVNRQVCTNILDLTQGKKFNSYGGNYSTYVRTKSENETNQMKAYAKQQDEIKHIKEYVWANRSCDFASKLTPLASRSFIASAGTYANLVKQAKSKQKVRPFLLRLSRCRR
jgi:ATPase subunit of ABC transporter with duplicated ATPase domains